MDQGECRWAKDDAGGPSRREVDKGGSGWARESIDGPNRRYVGRDGLNGPQRVKMGRKRGWACRRAKQYVSSSEATGGTDRVGLRKVLRYQGRSGWPKERVVEASRGLRAMYRAWEYSIRIWRVKEIYAE